MQKIRNEVQNSRAKKFNSLAQKIGHLAAQRKFYSRAIGHHLASFGSLSKHQIIFNVFRKVTC